MNNKVTFEIPFGDKPNANGRIYDRETVKKMCESINSKPYPITNPENEITTEVNLKEIKGFTESCSYDETNNRIEVTANVSDDILKLIKTGADIVPNGVGGIDAETRIVKDYNLIQFSITDKSAFKTKGDNFESMIKDAIGE